MIPGRAPSTPASHDPSVLSTAAVVEVRHGLAEVPDVAVAVLGEPVVGVLDQVAVTVTVSRTTTVEMPITSRRSAVTTTSMCSVSPSPVVS